MNEIENIKREIVKQAIQFKTGGFKPTYSKSESWIGKVYLYKENEEIPLDKNGDLMIPLLQICLDNLPFIPKLLSGTKVITVFVSKQLPVDLSINGENWLIRTYNSTDELIIKQLEHPNAPIKPFPLKPELVNEDYPVWDGGGLSMEQEDKILELEDKEIIDDYYDITENQYGHKIGGYPSFCQSGIDFGEGFEFALQIASDEKANLNIIDSGTIFLAKNKQSGAWKYYCDFY